MKVVIGGDFSESSTRVLDAALERLDSGGDELFLVHVAAPDPEFVGYRPGPQAARDAHATDLKSEREALEALAEKARERWFTTTPRLIEGPTTETLIAEAQSQGADLIVVGSHGHSMMHDLLLGSVSEGLLRRAPIPLLVVPVHDRENS